MDLAYAHDFQQSTYRIVELGSEDLVSAFESGSGIVIKGLPDDEAVLCTATKTFSVHQVNTSNSLLLATTGNNPMHVLHNLSSTIELQPCVPRLGTIDTLLEATRYSGSKNESNIADKVHNSKFYSYDDLLSLVQASEAELAAGLKLRHTFILNGKCRLLDRTYLNRLLDMLYTNATINGFDMQSISLENAQKCIYEGLEADESIAEPALMACIQSFVTDMGNTFSLSFDEYKVCRFIGEFVLSSTAGKEWERDDFLDVWKQLVPEGYRPAMSMLEGLVLSQEIISLAPRRVQHYVSYFPVSELSTDPAQRFATLFRRKKLWSTDDITPFLSDIAPDPKKRDALLLKFTRAQKGEDGKTLYGSRIK
ncbi:Sister chromatid cohesion protein DCC1 [Apophysomyces ossiformis]|uniref:Sister chromatid cohesion protein DCC1 n=1 Tax=Apophysomyces ossiformis TaxID=679940 RepID=A0A8H7BYA7_9FUNG|nr:Sister chromatid cohesion protein DCC1 [Apophysomyces ossiformis]